MSDAGTTFTIDIPVTAGGVEGASQAIKSLETNLDAASKAALASGDAMKAGQAAYSQAEQSANRAAKAVEKIGVAVAAQKSKLAAASGAGDDKSASAAAATLQALGVRQSEAVAKANAAKAALMGEAAALDKLKTAATTAEAAQKKIVKDLDALSKGKAEAEKKLKEGGEGFEFAGVSRGLGKLGGPLAEAGRSVLEVGEGFKKLGKQFGSVGALAIGSTVLIVALAAAVIALSVALIVGIAKIIEWGVKLADANHNALLLSEGIARTVAGGTLLNAKINALTKTIPQTREELSAMAKSLADSGLRGDKLSAALERAAIRAAQLKFGPNFREEMLSLDEQTKVFGADISETFGGLKTDALMKGLQLLIKLFDANTESGRAMKVVFESIFQPMVDGLAGAAPKIERFFLQFEILALKALIAIKPYGSTIVGIAKAFIELLVIVTVIGAALLALAAIPAAIVVGLIFLVDKFEQTGEAIGNFFKNLNLSTVAADMMAGLVNGIKSAGGAVIAALTGVVTTAINAVKGLLGIHSPSTVFAEIGMNTGAGMAEGVDSSAPRVSNSLESMIAPPSPGKPGKSAAPGDGAGAGSKSGMNLSNVKFEFHGVEGAADAEGKFRELFIRLLEGDSAQLGAAVPLGAT